VSLRDVRREITHALADIEGPWRDPVVDQVGGQVGPWEDDIDCAYGHLSRARVLMDAYVSQMKRSRPHLGVKEG
jgi:hypothetical protein